MSIFRQFVNLLFPNLCNACQEPLLKTEQFVCTSCILDLPKADIGFSNSQSLAHRFLGKVEIKQVFSFYKYMKGGKVQAILHNLKYKNKPELGNYFGVLYGNELVTSFSFDLDIILAVPLFYKKELLRGYNQSDEIAKGIAKTLNVPHETNIIIRKIATETQTKKTRIDRYFNVVEVFEVINLEKIKGKKVGLVDDVLTTGATIEVCAQALLAAGASEISIFVLASAI